MQSTGSCVTALARSHSLLSTFVMKTVSVTPIPSTHLSLPSLSTMRCTVSGPNSAAVSAVVSRPAAAAAGTDSWVILGISEFQHLSVKSSHCMQWLWIGLDWTQWLTACASCDCTPQADWGLCITVPLPRCTGLVQDVHVGQGEDGKGWDLSLTHPGR